MQSLPECTQLPHLPCSVDCESLVTKYTDITIINIIPVVNMFNMLSMLIVSTPLQSCVCGSPTSQTSASAIPDI